MGRRNTFFSSICSRNSIIIIIININIIIIIIFIIIIITIIIILIIIIIIIINNLFLNIWRDVVYFVYYYNCVC